MRVAAGHVIAATEICNASGAGTNVYFSQSGDAGASWSAPVIVNVAPANTAFVSVSSTYTIRGPNPLRRRNDLQATKQRGFWASQTGLEPGAHFTDYLVAQPVIDLSKILSGYGNESICM
jgi:hypothetical protein